MAVEEGAWVEAVESDDGDEVRDGAWVAEITERLDLSAWPEGARVIVRKERPHPGAQLSLFDVEAGLRHTAFITAPRSSAERDERGIALLELRHRRHARIEDRIRQAKAAGLRNLPCKEAPENHAWLECVLAAADLVCLVEAHLLRRRPRDRPLRDRRLPLPHLAHGRPAHTRRKGRCTSASIAPGHGPSSSPSASPGFVRRSPEPPHPSIDGLTLADATGDRDQRPKF